MSIKLIYNSKIVGTFFTFLFIMSTFFFELNFPFSSILSISPTDILCAEPHCPGNCKIEPSSRV